MCYCKFHNESSITNKASEISSIQSEATLFQALLSTGGRTQTTHRHAAASLRCQAQRNIFAFFCVFLDLQTIGGYNVYGG